MLTNSELAYLASNSIGRLATARPDGTLQNNPVAFIWNEAEQSVDIGGMHLGTSRKYANVQSNPKVAFVVDDVVSIDPWTVRGVEVRGRAVAIADYEPPQPWLCRQMIRIHPTRIVGWGLDPGVADPNGRDVIPES